MSKTMSRIAILFVGITVALAGCGKKTAPAQPNTPTDGSAAGETKPEPKPDAPTDKPAGGGGW